MGKQAKVWNGSAWVSISPSASDGKSAYQLALENGFSGSMSDWLLSLTGPIGPAGPAGPAGSNGPAGPPGVGIPTGGPGGYLLAKNSDADYDLTWVAPPTGGGGGSLSVIATAPYPTGGTVSTYTDGVTGYQYRVHTFTYTGAVDDFTVTNGVLGTLLLIGAGASGGANASRGGGGGGAGAVYFQPHPFYPGTNTLFVGAGGSGLSSSYGVNGEDTLWDGYPGMITPTTYIARGGGGGSYGRNSLPAFAGNSGGYGGGGGAQIGAGGGGTYGSIDGGATQNSTLFLGGSGGSTGSGSTVGGNGGGPGFTSDITGTSVTYSVGGSGDMALSAPGATPGSGGGNGGNAGADGIVIIRYRIA